MCGLQVVKPVKSLLTFNKEICVQYKNKYNYNFLIYAVA